MNFNISKRVLSLALILAISILFLIPTSSINVYANNSTYYVDSVSGSDTNSGTSTSSAWKTLGKVNGTTFQPGDKILLKASCTWTEQLSPKGSGINGSPIVVDMYGTGNKPKLDGLGAIENVVYLNNQQYWEINNLEITNYAATAAVRRAVMVEATDYGTVNHIYLKNLYIHDIKGDLTNKLNGGIAIYAKGSVTPTKYNDVLIDGCSFYMVDRSAVKLVVSDWCSRTSSPEKWYPSTNVVVSNNTLDNIGGDGITVRDTDGARVEYNVAKDCNKRCSSVSNKWNVAIWAFQADNSIFQYNEAYLTRTTDDGQGFDCDYLCNGTVMQYNYSHDNEGGFMLIMNNLNYNNNAIIRYNISQNDSTRIFQFNTGVANNTKIYNNTIYTNASISPKMFDIGSSGTFNTFYAYNNIFNMSSATQGSGVNYGVFDYNTYYPINAIASDSHANTANPLFVSPGSGSVGISTVDGYKLQSGSTCINSGMTISNNGGKDYSGNAVPYSGGATDRGAFEYQGTSTQSNLAMGKSPTASSTINNPTYATDGLFGDSNSYTGLGSNLQWIQYDLGENYDLTRIKLWHYYTGGRKYKDVVIMLSTTADFSSGVTTVFNNDNDNSAGLGTGTQAEYTESSEGKEINFNSTRARYVRFYSNGNYSNIWNHYVEAQIFGTPITPTNIARGKTPTASTTLTNTMYATDGVSNNANNFAGIGSGLQWMQLDLGSSYDLSAIKIWHFYSDGRKYNDVIVRVSNTSDFSSGVTTLFNNDTDNSSGIGTGVDATYSETSSGKTISFANIPARYVRLYSNGSTINTWNHCVEVEVYGK